MNARFAFRVLALALLLLYVFISGEALAGGAAGDKIDVLWKGKWYPATILKVKEDKCYIQYDGYDSSWNEWVGPDRMRAKEAKKKTSFLKTPSMPSFAEGRPSLALWAGSWNEALV